MKIHKSVLFIYTSKSEISVTFACIRLFEVEGEQLVSEESLNEDDVAVVVVTSKQNKFNLNSIK